MPNDGTLGCLRNYRGELLDIRTPDYLIPGRKVSYIQRAYEKDGTTPKGIRVFLEPPYPSDIGGVTGQPVEVVYLWIGWSVGGKEVWDTW